MRHPRHSWMKEDPRAKWNDGILATNTRLAAEVTRLREENARLRQALLLLLAAREAESSEPGEPAAN